MRAPHKATPPEGELSTVTPRGRTCSLGVGFASPWSDGPLFAVYLVVVDRRLDRVDRDHDHLLRDFMEDSHE